MSSSDTSDQSTALVIGGGIGGLTAAVALHQAGWRVTVLERAPALEPVGAGIALAPNAQRALDAIGVGDAVRAMAAWQSEGALRLPGGRVLARTDDRAAVRRFGGPVVVAHRADLIGLLAARLPAGAVRTATAATVTDPGDPADPDRPARVRLIGSEDHPAELATDLTDDLTTNLTTDLVIAADGIHSAARRALFPGHPAPRYVGLTTWRFVVPAPCGVDPHETWGPGALWGSQPLHDGRVYAYAAAVAPAGGRAPDDERAELLRRFGGWHRPVPDLLAAVAPADVLRNDVYAVDRPLPAYHRGRVALLGDAVHPMAPHLGQGGGQAIEDAIVLGLLAGPDADLAAALAEYTRVRLPRTTEVVRRSARIARLTTWRSAPARALRAALLAGTARLAPDLALRALDGIADWSPPGRP
ncbi:FAD-dependent monooxygenase [Streptomyces sp. NPDC000151]|uniref:FAD-dependent monooxygenase n=1 Tax=Streptomyces sp. NPDC000151 TaxID=3154244 RepID=UPI00332B43A6